MVHTTHPVARSPPVASLANTCTLLDSEDFLDVFANGVSGAKASIKISLYMLAESWGYPMPPSENLLKLLAKAASNGLDCRAILAIIPKRYALPDFNRGAAQVLQDAGWLIRFMPAERFLHDKLFIFDQNTTILGSHNLSKTAMMSSYNLSVKIENAAFTHKATEVFWKRWQLSSTPNGHLS
ncbi:putative PLD phosphodiesterase domain-containing protein [Gammaproteobacteria bacterium]